MFEVIPINITPEILEMNICESYCIKQTVHGFNYGISQSITNISILLFVLLANVFILFLLNNILSSYLKKENCDTEKKIKYRKIGLEAYHSLFITLIGITALMILLNFLSPVSY